jgi:hypothetical protein
MQVCLASSTSGPTSFGSGLHNYIFIYGGEVCGRYADDARLIRASVTAVGSHSKLPSSVIILINGRLFSLESRVCTSILTLQFWHHTNYHSILVTYPPHAVTSPSLTNLGPVARLDRDDRRGAGRETPPLRNMTGRASETHSTHQM